MQTDGDVATSVAAGGCDVFPFSVAKAKSQEVGLHMGCRGVLVVARRCIYAAVLGNDEFGDVGPVVYLAPSAPPIFGQEDPFAPNAAPDPLTSPVADGTGRIEHDQRDADRDLLSIAVGLLRHLARRDLIRRDAFPGLAAVVRILEPILRRAKVGNVSIGWIYG